MEWTAAPTVEGFYWLRSANDSKPWEPKPWRIEIVDVKLYEGRGWEAYGHGFEPSYSAEDFKDCRHQFYGPLEVPEG
jgi:hypothetical protein